MRYAYTYAINDTNRSYNIELSISQTKYYICPFSCFFQELAFDPNKSMRNRIYIAYCVPHTCNSGDVSKHIKGILRDFPQKEITTSIGTVKCQTNTALPWTWGDYTFLYVLLIKYYINNIIIILCFLMRHKLTCMERVVSIGYPTGYDHQMCSFFLHNFRTLCYRRNTKYFFSQMMYHSYTCVIIISIFVLFFLWQSRVAIYRPRLYKAT